MRAAGGEMLQQAEAGVGAVSARRQTLPHLSGDRIQQLHALLFHRADAGGNGALALGAAKLSGQTSKILLIPDF